MAITETRKTKTRSAAAAVVEKVYYITYAVRVFFREECSTSSINIHRECIAFSVHMYGLCVGLEYIRGS